MELLLSVLGQVPEYQKLLQAAEKNQIVGLSGVAQLGRSHMIASLIHDTQRPLVVLCQDEIAAKRLQEELQALLDAQYPVLPTRELNLYDAVGVSHSWEQQRLCQLYRLWQGQTRALIMTWDAASLRTMPPQQLAQASVVLQAGQQYELEQLVQQLVQAGYQRSSLVEGVGQFAVRGGIVDLYSPAAEQPLRVEFFGDEVDAIGYFDPLTQRRTDNAAQAVLLPVAEAQPALHPGGQAGLVKDLQALIARQKRRRHLNEPLLQTLAADVEKLENGLPFAAADRYMALIYPTFATAMDYLPQDAIVVFCDHGGLRRTAKASQENLGLQLDGLLQAGSLAGELCEYQCSYDALCSGLADHAVVFLDAFLGSAYPEALEPKQLLAVSMKQLPSYGGSLDTAASDLAHYQRQNFGTLVLCGSRRRGEILYQALHERGIGAMQCFPASSLPKPGQILLTDGALPAGLEYPTLHLAILTEGQFTAKQTVRKASRAKAATNRQKLQAFTDLTPGDLVVHTQYGIGRYVAMEQIKMDGIVKDYVKIAYQGTDVLYVPATQLDMISKYIGGGEQAQVRLNKLGGDAWQKTKTRARAAAKDMAEELIKLYAQRRRTPGYAFAPDSPWQTEFEQSFPYAETDDQLRCIEQIKRDMESPTPMDRLLCGDVGFGKTEVALRAAMKAMLDGKQVAILVPTTVLAQQHYQTAVSRFANFPVQIEVLSRFRTPAQQKKTLAGLKAGSVDMVIGTHKLLQKSVEFHNLGLLVVDEEQRFGVSHKERLKEMSQGVDVLTLSATPIPRTLNMALSGIRDMSTIEEPPQDRYPVQTFVMEHSEAVVDEAIRREIARGGQVYYLHNRVETIARCASALKARNEGISVAVAHGKMQEEALSELMQSMADGQIDVLVCTTIIETGIDIPNVNTLIIENADCLGLAQLHQLRGRVGRANRHAFAYLTYRRNRVLTEQAEKRLNAVREFAEFGSGFKIAMRDLEIRGAGNLLGAEQSGHMLSVGYDMYLKLLEEAVLEEQGKTPQVRECTADLQVVANIDKDYVSSGAQRMDLYRRMAAIRTRADGDDLLDEIVDRYGEPPKGVLRLIDIALLRAAAAEAGICEIHQKGLEIQFTLAELDLDCVGRVCSEAAFQGRVFFAADEKRPMLKMKLHRQDDALQAAQFFVKTFASFVSTAKY